MDASRSSQSGSRHCLPHPESNRHLWNGANYIDAIFVAALQRPLSLPWELNAEVPAPQSRTATTGTPPVSALCPSDDGQRILLPRWLDGSG